MELGCIRYLLILEDTHVLFLFRSYNTLSLQQSQSVTFDPAIGILYSSLYFLQQFVVGSRTYQLPFFAFVTSRVIMTNVQLSFRFFAGHQVFFVAVTILGLLDLCCPCLYW